MNDRRRPSSPPDLTGYDYSRFLGLGGFADVFLYRQQLPARQVAVKVLIAPGMDAQLRERFVTEANLMAQLSHHPAIVTVYQAGFADDGRPFLVMEYCSRPGLAERYRVERMGVAECLRIGVRLASAVATAHSAGILHRDIKPANVLTTDFGWPALTDFGIAATTRQAEGAAVGMSIPWAPPELLGPRPSGDERSDVYSLAATVYSLLAGHSPFEVAGTANSAGELVARIERMRLPAVGRDDVPLDLVGVLEQAMAKRPERRFTSATAFARSLQAVEDGLGLPATPLDLAGEDAHPGAEVRSLGHRSHHESTRTRSTVDLVGPPPSAGRRSSDRPRGAQTVPAPPGPPELSRELPVVADEVEGGSAARSRLGRRIAGGAVVVAAVAVVGVALVTRPPQAPTTSAGSSYLTDTSTMTTVVPAPADLAGVRHADGSVTFTWANPDPQTGDTYLWGELSLTQDPQLATVTTTQAVVPAEADQGQVCIQVSIVRANNRTSTTPAKACAP